MYLQFLLCTLIAFVVWKKKVLSFPASSLAFLFALSIWVFNGFGWMAILLSFLVFAFVVTKWKYDVKKELEVQEASLGERDIENVIGNGAAAMFFALAFMPTAFCGAVAAALSDTMASEIGVLSDKTRMITNLQKVKPGTNGAISPLGMTFSFIGAAIISLLGYLVLSLNPFACLVGGFLGCQVDSYLGATLERKGYLSNSLVNLISTFAGGGIAFLIATV
ncbi:MAG: DUF92 domain-containing protein [Candidatus Aenigmatarchaeota archaeon]